MTRHALTLVTGADGFPVDPMEGVRRYEGEAARAFAALNEQLGRLRLGMVIVLPALPDRHALGVCP